MKPSYMLISILFLLITQRNTYAQAGIFEPLGSFLDCKNEFVKNFPENERHCRKKMNKKFCTLFFNAPADVQQLIGNEQLCQYFAGEVGSGIDEREAEINKAIKGSGCEFNAEKGMELLRRYWGKQEVMHTILFFSHDYEDAYYNQCSGTNQ